MQEDDLEEWGYLSLPNGARISLNHWENIIGRAKASDVTMDYPTLSRSHAAVIRDDKGLWRVYDLGSKSGVLRNGKKVEERSVIENGDTLTLGGVELFFVTMGRKEHIALERDRIRPGKVFKPFSTLLFLSAFQIALGLQLCISMDAALPPSVPISFAALIVLTWLCYILTRLLRRVAFEIETIAFLLSTIGLAVAASSSPDDLYRQLVLLFAGVCLYYLLGWFLRDLDRAVRLRWPMAVAGILLLALNLLLSRSAFGAKNWLTIAGVSFQPSEFVKLAFVFVGAATLDRLFAKRNLVLFIAFSGICVMALALMGDFGTALVFFIAYLTISFIRSGNVAAVFLSLAGAGFAGFIAMTLKPHVAARFATWGHVWQQLNDAGYQQTRTMMAAADGGLFGVGAGNGWLKHIFAADTDMVFGVVSEELGLIVAAAAVFALLVLVFYTVRASSSARSSFYVIGASAAVSILVFQMILNVFGSVDILPFTGVTFPFVSKGGSSLIACWGLLAFVKAVDIRKNASFVVRTPRSISKRERLVQRDRRRASEAEDGEQDFGEDFEPRYDDGDMEIAEEFDFGDIFDKDE
jgi:cell division protein FtsW (lipid II flippase)